jgi:hypothetical protein
MAGSLPPGLDGGIAAAVPVKKVLRWGETLSRLLDAGLIGLALAFIAAP